MEQDSAQAAVWYAKAAAQGHMQAQLNLGIAYITDNGVAQDDRKAALWFAKAAVQGMEEVFMHYYSEEGKNFT